MPSMTAFEKTGSTEKQVKDSANNVIQLADKRERQLIERIAIQRDQDALEVLYTMLRSRVCGFLRRLTHDNTLIDEAYNEVMYQVWSKAAQFKGNAKVSSWVFTIAYRTCLGMLKKQNKQYELQDQLEMIEEQVTEDHVQQLVESRIIERALLELAPKQRMVLELNYYMGFSLPEIAEITHSGLNTVKARLRYARHKLRDVVELMESDQSVSRFAAQGELL
ncbi:MAG: RNA polymerase sigma factor [Pseudomonadota bacterium]